jgi:hypothetical protein
MVLQLNISPQAEAELKRRAAEAGVDVTTYTTRQIERLAAGALTLDDLSGPAHAEFLQSNLTDDQFGDFLEQAKHEMRRTQEPRP